MIAGGSHKGLLRVFALTERLFFVQWVGKGSNGHLHGSRREHLFRRIGIRFGKPVLLHLLIECLARQPERLIGQF